MKKLALAVAALSLSMSTFAADLPGQGQIKFTGMVTTAGCTVVPVGSNGTIALGSVPVKNLEGGKTSPWVSGVLKFEQCSSESNDGVKVFLSINPGTPMVGNANAWANEGDAKNVGIEVEVVGGSPTRFNPIPPTGTEKPIETLDATVGGNVKYVVRGRMVGGTGVKAGSVAATLAFTAEYR